MGTRPVLFAVGTACLCGAGNRSKQHPRKTGPPIMPVYTDSCKRLIGRVFTAARPNLNGAGTSPGVTPGRARETTEGAVGRPLRGARRSAAGAGQPTNGRLYLCRGGLGSRPTVGSTFCRGGLSSRPTVGSTSRRFGQGPMAGYFFFGAIIITICRPSRRGRDSITMSSPRSPSIRLAISRPSS